MKPLNEFPLCAARAKKALGSEGEGQQGRLLGPLGGSQVLLPPSHPSLR